MQIGTRLGPYVILGPLGAGGMGEVYRARDERLEREVAVKILPARVAADPDLLRRFAQEARTAGSINHPNILVVHDLGAHDGVPFLVTELLAGETLRERLRTGTLPPRQALELGVQIAAGLAAAHERGIVHRDLKPDNLFLTGDGVVKILDFGLAKSTAGELGTDPAEHTHAGSLIGTPAYMAPEQARGMAVDHRADIFALGCILHEMIAGQSPFARATLADTLGAVLTADPPSLAERTPGDHAGVERAIAHCLEKRREDRFQSARDLGFDLRVILADSSRQPVPSKVRRRERRRRPRPLLFGLAAGAVAAAAAVWLLGDRAPWRIGGSEPNRIVVTVLTNETGDPTLDPVGRMASDWITQGLLRIQGLDVVPSTSLLFIPPGSGVGPGAAGEPWRQIVNETGAGTVISGAYYRQGEMLQFQVRVVDARGGKLILALDPVTGPASAPMQAMDELRQRLMGALAAREEAAHYLSASQEPPLYDAYLEFIAGFELFLTDEAQALRHFQRSSAIDSTFYAPLLYGAYVYNRMGDNARSETILAGLAEKREQLAPLTRGFLDSMAAFVAHRYPEALQALYDVRSLAPRDPLLIHWIGYLAYCCNLPRETVATFTQFGSRPWSGHPLGAEWMRVHCASLHLLGQHRQELERAREGARSATDRLALSLLEIDALAALGRLDELNEVVARSTAAAFTVTTPGEVLLEAAMELRAHGRREQSLAFARQAVAWYRERFRDTPARDDLRRGLLAALRWAEEWEEAADLCRAHLQEAPDDVMALGSLGASAARLGDRAEALRVSAALSQFTGPHLFGTAVYCRACIGALLGEKPEAIGLLRRAFAEGVAYSLSHHRQIDLEPLWDTPEFQELLRPRG